MPTFGEHLREQVEERLKYFETGQVPQKNIDVMNKAQVRRKLKFPLLTLAFSDA